MKWVKSRRASKKARGDDWKLAKPSRWKSCECGGKYKTGSNFGEESEHRTDHLESNQHQRYIKPELIMSDPGGVLYRPSIPARSSASLIIRPYSRVEATAAAPSSAPPIVRSSSSTRWIMPSSSSSSSSLSVHLPPAPSSSSRPAADDINININKHFPSPSSAYITPPPIQRNFAHRPTERPRPILAPPLSHCQHPPRPAVYPPYRPNQPPPPPRVPFQAWRSEDDDDEDRGDSGTSFPPYRPHHPPPSPPLFAPRTSSSSSSSSIALHRSHFN